MSRGPGKRERQMQDVLGECSGWTTVEELAVFVYHPERFWFAPDNRHYYDFDANEDRRYTRAEYTATHRAVKRLAKLGVVETRIEIYAGLKGPEGRGGTRRQLTVRLTKC